MSHYSRRGLILSRKEESKSMNKSEFAASYLERLICFVEHGGSGQQPLLQTGAKTGILCMVEPCHNI